jgi:hypothetical protein
MQKPDSDWDRERLEALLRSLTQPLQGQYPRPWMTNHDFKARPRVFVVGYNQATRFVPAAVGDHDVYIDALFNRNGRSCRGLYDSIRDEGKPSRTRPNVDGVTRRFSDLGVYDVIETNVVCFSSPMSPDLAGPEYAGGKQVGSEIFRVLMHEMRPRVLIAHGSRTRRSLEKVLGVTMPTAPGAKSDGVRQALVRGRDGWVGNVVCIPSLAPPAWTKWCSWAPGYLDEVCKAAVSALA